MHKFVRCLGWTEWDQFIGVRADEQRRWPVLPCAA